MRREQNRLKNLIVTTMGLEIEDVMIGLFFKNFPAAFYWIDRNGYFLDCNDNELKALDLSSKEKLIGRHSNDVADWRAWENSKNVMQANRPLVIEETHIGPTGNKTTFLSIKNPLYDKADNVVGMNGMAIDITDRKKMEEELQIAKNKAESALKAKEQAETEGWEKSLILRDVLKELKEKRYYLTGKYQSVYLTTREAQCIPCLARGLSAKEIGAELGLSKRTIEVYLNNLKSKLNCNSRSQLITAAIECHFLDGIRPNLKA